MENLYHVDKHRSSERILLCNHGLYWKQRLLHFFSGLGQVVSLWDPVIKKKLENYLEEQEYETEDIEEVVQNWVENGIETGLNEFTTDDEAIIKPKRS